MLAAGILSFATYAGAMFVLLRLDRVAWQHEPRQRLGVYEKVSLLVYFQPGTTDAQVEEFVHTVVEEKDGRLPPFVTLYWRLAPDQANGHESIALGLNDQAPGRQLASYVGRIRNDPRVEEVHENVAPAEVGPPSR